MSRIVAFVLIALTGLAGCQTAPLPALPAATQPARAGAAFDLTPVEFKDVPRVTFLYARTQTTFADMGRAIDELVPILERQKAMTAAVTGPMTFVYRSRGNDPTQPFELLIGYPVREGQRATGRFTVGTLDARRCAVTQYTGPMSTIDRAYAHLYAALAKSGPRPGREARELYWRWENPESRGNVTEVQVVVER